MFTPPTPRPTYSVLLLVLLLATSHLGIAQFVKLQPLTEYEASLKAFHTQKVRTQCVEFEQKTKMKWWYYLPSIGFQFGLPSISAGTSQLVNIDQTKQQNRAKLAAIISQGLLDYRTELHQLRNMYEGLKVEREALTYILPAQNLESSIVNVAEEANRKKEIKPVEYAEALLRFQRQWMANDRMEREFALRILEIARFSRYQFPTETLPGLDSLQSVRSVSAAKPVR